MAETLKAASTAMNTERDGAEPEHLRQVWDAIVVGTGMGGATIGHRLARAGKKVLFCELGGVPTTTGPLLGEYPELAAGRRGGVLDASQAAALLEAGRCADTLVDESRARPRSFVPFVGYGPGGSSALYGMAMERFMLADFHPGVHHASAPGAAVVAAWPISYEELAPSYAEAEALYRVRGGLDPLAAAQIGAAAPPVLLPPPPISPAAGELASFLAGRGLHPYRLPSACEFNASCQSCQGFLCPSPCKNDANSVCLQPALRAHGASLLQGCRVLGVRTQGRRATGVHCLWAGRELELQARAVVLAAGALQSPLILLRSQDGRGHEGLGNASGLVGRHLMRHYIDIYLVRPHLQAGVAFDNRRKEIACNDFYVDGGGNKLGTIQSFGRLPPAEMLFASLRDDLGATGWSWLAPALALARPFMRPVLRDMVENRLALATIAEDLPYADNAVAPHPAGLSHSTLRYAVHAEGVQRVAAFRRHMAGVLRGRSWRLVPQADNNHRIAHVCGTCRFGDDPRLSVLDRDNRLHDLDNLFVVDSSFFPSSGGTNPSLTIAANALRVGARIADQLL
jgi:choline dehydrogenase-like flavoprotein